MCVYVCLSPGSRVAARGGVIGDMGGRIGDFERERARFVAADPARVSLSVEREREGIVGGCFGPWRRRPWRRGAVRVAPLRWKWFGTSEVYCSGCVCSVAMLCALGALLLCARAHYLVLRTGDVKE